MITLGLIDDIESLYPTLEEWWHGHGWPAVPQQILPRLGIVATFGKAPIAACWLYMDNSVGVAMLEWIVTDPEAKPRRAAIALARMIDFAKSEAKALDYGVILTTCRQESLAKLLTRGGFTQTDREMIHLLTILD